MIEHGSFGGDSMKPRGVIFGFLLLTFCMSIGRSYAEDVWTVRQLHGECLSDDLFVRNSCLAFITGVLEAMVIYGQEIVIAPEFRDRFAICPEGMIGNHEVYKIFLSWAEKHPEAWDQHQGNGVMSAIRDRWPCNK